ncbi:MAG: hypothetical protein ABEK04_00980 [Candidatus Nanohalobium sp.]
MKKGADDVLRKLKSAEEFSDEIVPESEGELGEIQKKIIEEYREDFSISFDKIEILGDLLTEQEESKIRKQRTKWDLSDGEFGQFLELFLKLAYAEGKLYVNQAEDRIEESEEKIRDVEKSISRGDPKAMEVNMKEAKKSIVTAKKKIQDSAKEFKAIIFVIEEFDSYSFSEKKEEKAEKELKGVKQLNDNLVEIYDEWEEITEKVEEATG